MKNINIPSSLEAEEAVIGILISDNVSFEKTIGKISKEDFYYKKYRLIYEGIFYLFNENKPFDAITLSNYFKSDSRKNIIDINLLFSITNKFYIVSNINYYIDIVKKKSILRNIILSSEEIIKNIYQKDVQDISSIEDIINFSENKIFDISRKIIKNDNIRHINILLESSKKSIKDIQDKKGIFEGIKSGFNDLDSIISGFQKGDLIIVAGRPSMGKTSFFINIIENNIDNSNNTILVFSMEMSSEQIALRMISSIGKIDQQKIKKGILDQKDWKIINNVIEKLQKTNIFIDDSPNLSPMHIKLKIRKILRSNKKIGLVIIDYLQLMSIPHTKENRTNEISEISRSLKTLAREFNITIIALSQLNRGLEMRQDKRPIMSDLRDSGAIEQDADIITFIYRDEIYYQNSNDKGVAEIIIAKNRNGPIGKVKLAFLGKYTRFENYQSIDYINYG